MILFAVYTDCPVVPISGGNLSSNNTGHCSSLSVSCDVGYTLGGDSSLTCCNGTWSAATPSCNKGELYVLHRNIRLTFNML